MVINLISHPLPASSPSLSQFPAPLLVFPGITPFINYLQWTSHLWVSFWGNLYLETSGKDIFSPLRAWQELVQTLMSELIQGIPGQGMRGGTHTHPLEAPERLTSAHPLDQSWRPPSWGQLHLEPGSFLTSGCPTRGHICGQSIAGNKHDPVDRARGLAS